MRFRAKSRGMTLIELIITIAIFGGFSLLLTVLVIGAIRNYSRGRAYQAVRSQTSDLVKKIADDIKMAYTPPTLGTGSWVPSGVIVPNPYGYVNSSTTGDIGTGIADDRVVMFVPREDIEKFDINDPMQNAGSGTPQLKFVEYTYVVENNVKRIRRNTYSIPKPGATETYGNYKRDGTTRWLLLSPTLADTIDRSDVILELPDAEDEVWFQVKRPVLPLPGELAYGTTYDRHMLEVTARMTRYVRGDKKLPIFHEEKTQVQTKVK